MSFNVFEVTQNRLLRKDVPVSAAAKVTSTNELAKQEAFSLAEPFKVYLADQQTQGRGRHDNDWENSSSGHGLAITFSIDPFGAPQPVTSPLAGLHVYKALSHAFELSTLSLKAPNDIYLGEKKLAGILVEVNQMGESFRLIVGIGLNVFSAPKSLALATYLATGIEVTQSKWEIFLDQLVFRLRELSRSCLSSHLSDHERGEILLALNRNPMLKEKLDQVSPFGDLVSPTGTQSWRTL